jgi:isocitrate dehydrogenase
LLKEKGETMKAKEALFEQWEKEAQETMEADYVYWLTCSNSANATQDKWAHIQNDREILAP